MPSEIADVYLDFDWDKRTVWALDLESETIDRSLLNWHLILPFWSSRPPEPLFDLQPQQVIAAPSTHRVHARRIEKADLRFPLDVMPHQGRLCIMDGIHRLAKAVLLDRQEISVRRIPRELLPTIRSGRTSVSTSSR